MAFASLFTLLDDIASVLDDVALMTKMAAKKTVGVVGDDLALNANQVTGVDAHRELPIVWAVAKGSLINKLILVPLALLISWIMPALITPLLMIGGAYLCYEGVEKLIHKFFYHEETPQSTPDELSDERAKIKGAIRTDFILSAEIIIIALGIVAEQPIHVAAVVMFAIGIGMTLFVYGLVGGIVKLDDFGFWLMRRGGATAVFGRMVITVMPWFMRALSVVGTLAMFLVGGGIMVHGLGFVHDFLHAHHWDSGLPAQLAVLVVGILTGIIVCAVVLPAAKHFSRKH